MYDSERHTSNAESPLGMTNQSAQPIVVVFHTSSQVVRLIASGQKTTHELVGVEGAVVASAPCPSSGLARGQGGRLV